MVTFKPREKIPKDAEFKVPRKVAIKAQQRKFRVTFKFKVGLNSKYYRVN
jgi:hypothetical protein